MSLCVGAAQAQQSKPRSPTPERPSGGGPVSISFVFQTLYTLEALGLSEAFCTSEGGLREFKTLTSRDIASVAVVGLPVVSVATRIIVARPAVSMPRLPNDHGSDTFQIKVCLPTSSMKTKTREQEMRTLWPRVKGGERGGQQCQQSGQRTTARERNERTTAVDAGNDMLV